MNPTEIVQILGHSQVVRYKKHLGLHKTTGKNNARTICRCINNIKDNIAYRKSNSKK